MKLIEQELLDLITEVEPFEEDPPNVLDILLVGTRRGGSGGIRIR